MNKVLLSGTIGAVSRHGDQAFIRLVTKDTFKQRGEGDKPKYHTVETWHDIVAHRKMADRVEKALQPGHLLEVEAWLTYNGEGKAFVNLKEFNVLRVSRKKSQNAPQQPQQ